MLIVFLKKFILFSNCAMYIIAPSCTLNDTLTCHTVSEGDFSFHV